MLIKQLYILTFGFVDLINSLGFISRINKTQLHLVSLQFVCLYLLRCLQLYFSSHHLSQQTANSENIFRLNLT